MTTLLLIVSYFIGSIPFGLWLGRACCHVDLRECGSGNIGATNAWRVLGWKVGLPVFVLDLAKGLVPVLLAKYILGSAFHAGSMANGAAQHPSTLEDSIIVGCGIAAILGHNFSPFLKFKGGKGVATSCGVALAMSWKAGLAGFLVWAVLIALTRTISLSSVLGTPVGAVGIWLDNGKSLPYGLFGILATAFVIVKHIPNMKRLVAGTEPKIGAKK